jgi:hypothetical protein
MPTNPLYQRLHNQRISCSDFKSPVEAVAWLGAMQGQDYAGVKWSVGLRVPGSTDACIEQALAERTILRTWVMRGTLHLVAAEDIRWLVSLFAERIIANSSRRYQQLELDAATLKRTNDLIADAVQDGQPHSRTELMGMIREDNISTLGQRTPYILQRASYDGLICQINAPRNDPLLIAMPDAKTLPREEAVAELVRRYFTSRGPATIHDFAGWSGLTLTEARAGLETVKAHLLRETMDNQTYWRGDAPASEPLHALYLLPGFDEYVLGYRDRSRFLEAQHADKICPGGNGIFFPTIVIDGQIVGTWKRAIKKNTAIITTEMFDRPLTNDEREVFTAAAQRLGAFLEMDVTFA